MKSRIEEVLSRILSEKHDAIVKVRFEEREDEQRRDNHRASRVSPNARKRNKQITTKNNAN